MSETLSPNATVAQYTIVSKIGEVGFQPYSLFACDSKLDRIRQAPEFIQFMAEMKAQNEKYQREFGVTTP